jgi:serine/threonine protein kinase
MADIEHQRIPSYALNWQHAVEEDQAQNDFFMDVQHGDKELEAQGAAVFEEAMHMPVSLPPRPPSPEASGWCGSCCTKSTPRQESYGHQRNDSEARSIVSVQSWGNTTFGYSMQKTDSFVNFAQLAIEAQTLQRRAYPAQPQMLVDLSSASTSVLGNTYSTTPRVIGWGAEGTIRIVKRGRDSVFAVAKVFKSGSGEIHLIRAAWEFRVGSLIRGHPNVIQVLDLISEANLAATIMEYAPGGNLRQSLVKGYVKNQRMADGIFVQMVRGILWMHSQGVSHRDVKLENMLWHPHRPLLKITDFGNCDMFWARPIPSTSQSQRYQSKKGSIVEQIFVEDRDTILPDAQTWKAEVRLQMEQQKTMSEELIRAIGLGHGQGAAAALPTLIQPTGSNPSIPISRPAFNMQPLHESDIPDPEVDDPNSPRDFEFSDDMGQAHHPIPPMLRPPAPWNMPPVDDDRALNPLSRNCPIRLSHGCVGTTAYIAPEEFASLSSKDPRDVEAWYDSRLVDVWMLGIAYIYLTTQLVPWPAASVTEHLFVKYRDKGTNKIIDTVFGVKQINGTRMTDSEGAKRCLRRMLTCDPTKRIMLPELEMDAWFQKRAEVYDREVEDRRFGSKGFYLDPADGPSTARKSTDSEGESDNGIVF